MATSKVKSREYEMGASSCWPGRAPLGRITFTGVPSGKYVSSTDPPDGSNAWRKRKTPVSLDTLEGSSSAPLRPLRAASAEPARLWERA